MKDKGKKFWTSAGVGGGGHRRKKMWKYRENILGASFYRTALPVIFGIYQIAWGSSPHTCGAVDAVEIGHDFVKWT